MSLQYDSLNFPPRDNHLGPSEQYRHYQTLNPNSTRLEAPIVSVEGTERPGEMQVLRENVERQGLGQGYAPPAAAGVEEVVVVAVAVHTR